MFPCHPLAHDTISKDFRGFLGCDRTFLCICRVISTRVETELKQSMSLCGFSLFN